MKDAFAFTYKSNMYPCPGGHAFAFAYTCACSDMTLLPSWLLFYASAGARAGHCRMKPSPNRRAGPRNRVAAHSGHLEVAVMIMQRSSLVTSESGACALRRCPLADARHARLACAQTQMHAHGQRQRIHRIHLALAPPSAQPKRHPPGEHARTDRDAPEPVGMGDIHGRKMLVSASREEFAVPAQGSEVLVAHSRAHE